MNESQPLVSVITPVYNGAKYIAECIESVLAQTYKHFEYIIVNNCSTDMTLEIARKYALRDSRIFICNNGRLLNIMQNHNHALRFISEKSRYTKIVHADDWLYPECIDRMVDVAEKNPNVGLVSAYRLNGSKVELCGLPYTRAVVSGREICRRTLLGDIYVFGTPSSHLIRSDLIKQRNPFYDESLSNSDHDACYRILEDTDIGFVHQVLTFTRAHDGQLSAVGRRYSYMPGKLNLLKKYGPVYLSDDEYKQTLRQSENNYYRYLAKNMLKMRDREFWEYHRSTLREAQDNIRPGRLLKETIFEICDIMLNPKTSLQKVSDRMSRFVTQLGCRE